MVTRAQKVRLGIFVAVSMTFLIGSLVMLAGLHLMDVRDIYTVRFEGSVSGLEVGAQVKYNGVRVGRVDSVRINPDDVSEVIVKLSLDADTPIKTDTRAVLNLAGITGLKFIELTLGSRESDFVEPGGEIPAGESLMDRLTGQAEDIATKAELLLNNLNRLLDEDNRARFSAILANLDEATAAMAQMVEENRANVELLAANLAHASAALTPVLTTLETEGRATLAAIADTATALGRTVDRAKVDRVLTSTDRVLGNVDRLVGTAQRKIRASDVEGLITTMGRLANQTSQLVASINLTVLRSREDLYGSLTYLLEGMENFADFTRMVRENPALLLSGQREEERVLR